MNSEDNKPIPLQPDEIIQISPPHKWGGCLAVVSETKPWGCQAYVSMPNNDGTPPGQAFIRLQWEEFERIRASIVFAPADWRIRSVAY